MRFVALAAFALLAPDGERDNQPDNVRPIPPPGIAVPEADRAELEAGLRELGEAIAALRPSFRERPDLLADVEIYHKAVRYALHHGEFFTPKEIAAAKDLVKEARARAEALLTGKPPWTAATGPIVRGYYSAIDGSVQPYGLVVPAAWKPGDGKKYRLDFWLHGRDEKLTELKFIDQRRKSPGEFVPPDTFVLHLYGRFCNASKFAGETDLFEALGHVRKNYPIDDDRLVVRGFSMGGASTWHFAVHHAGLWAAAAPGAGFAETPVYARMFNDPVKPADYERKLWSWYNATDYAANLSNCPVVAYSGELDKQKQAADIMAEAMKKEGLELVHLVGPKTEHKYEPETKKELNRRIDALAARGRDPFPASIRFTTWTLRYDRMKWLRVDGLERHWERARVDAAIEQGAGKVRTENVSALSLEWPAARKPIGERVVLDDQTILFTPPPPGPTWSLHFRKEQGRWTQARSSDDGALRKRHGLQGPIDDAFMDAFVFVAPTGKPLNAALGAWVERERKEAVEAWRRTMRGDVREFRDVDFPEAWLDGNHLVLWGDPSSNSVLARIADRLPIRWTAEGVKVGDKVHPAERSVPVLVYPNPLNPKRYVVLNSGFTWKENAALSNSRHVPLLPDWAVLDATVSPAKRMSERVVQAGFFGESWELK